MKKIEQLVAILLIVGGLNWGLIGAFQFDLVDTMLGDIDKLPAILYTFMGVSAVYTLYSKMTRKTETTE